MKKNITEINLPKYSFTFDSPETQKMKENNKLKEYKYKIEQEIKTHPMEFAKNLKRNLTKHELTPELYIPKKISRTKDYDKNLIREGIVYSDIAKQPNRKNCALLTWRGARDIIKRSRELDGK